MDAINGDDLPLDSELPTEVGSFLEGKYHRKIELYLN